MEIHIGQMLRNQNGEKAIVKKVLFEFVFIEYHDSIKRIRKSSIGNEWTIDGGEICSKHDVCSSDHTTAISHEPSVPEQPSYDQDGCNRFGYNKSGYDRFGYNKNGYDKDGFDKQGFNQAGFDVAGYDRDGFDQKGFNRQGFDRFGWRQDGYNRDGYNRLGFDRAGYDKQGFNKFGFNAEGFDRQSFDKEGFNREGFNSDGYNRDGLSRNGDMSPVLREKFIPDQTKIYHRILGPGVFSGFTTDGKNSYIKVRFEKRKDTITRFTYPDSLNNFIFLNQPKFLAAKEKFMNTEYGRIQFDEELNHFISVSKKIKNTLPRGEFDIYIPGNSEDYNDDERKQYVKQRSENARKATIFNQISGEPYFARIDYRNNICLYIGKNSFGKEIVDWADPICSYYYDYQIYIGNKDINLSLVRDFDIHAGEFLGFYDKYNQLLWDKTKSHEEDESAITDQRLLMIIRTQRSDNRIHDIIASIQANQYQIITQDKTAFLSVCGCAGSGKTMIMFHRLRYLLYNNRDINIKQTFLISPIDLLLQASDELSQTLQIQSANHMTTAQFYQYIITLYKRSRQIPGDTRQNILLNDVLDAQKIETLYSRESCDKFQANIREPFENQGLFDRFIQVETQRVRRLLIDFGCKTGDTLSSLLQDDDFYNQNLSTYEAAKNELRSYSLENAKGMKKSEEEARHFTAGYLDYLIQNKLFIGTTKLTNDGTAIKQYSELGNLRCLFNDMAKNEKNEKENLNIWDNSRNQLKEEYSHNGKYRDPLELFAAYKMLHDRVIRLQTFARNHDFTYLCNLISNKIQEIKQRLLLAADTTYEWELFYTCLGFYTVCGQIDDEVRYIFLDEFQDFAPVELDCMRHMLPNGVFNLFGDPKQCITPKGIKNAQDIPFQTAQYELNENYRNALEITEYVNQEFDMHMLPVGIHGVVRKVNQVSVTSGELEAGDRIAVIYKEKDFLAHYNVTEEDPLFSFLNKQDGEFISQKINVLSIFQAKGLEFEKVFVISEGMNESEKYVAMTRALNELMILT